MGLGEEEALCSMRFTVTLVWFGGVMDGWLGSLHRMLGECHRRFAALLMDDNAWDGQSDSCYYYHR